jgi:hypothetical protein
MKTSRRALVGFGVLAALTPTQAMANLLMPLKEPPPRVRPLGQWSILVRPFEVVQIGAGPVDVSVPLQFRSQVEMATPIERWWHRSAAFPLPITEATLPPMTSGLWTDVPFTLTIPATLKKGGYRVSCDMTDPVTKRRATYSFVVHVLDHPRA